MLLISILSFFNIIFSYYFDLFLNVNNYAYTFVFSLLIGLFLIFFKNFNFRKIDIYEKVLLVIFGFLFFPLIISIPFYFSISNISFLNCYFEAISGFTSTGFTIFDNIKQLDQSLLIWRSTSQWIGGLYFLFSLLLLIDIFDENLKKSITNYISFNSSEILKQSLKIIIIYSSMTFVIFIVLNLIDIRTPSFINAKFKLTKNNNLMELNKRLKKIDLVQNIYIQQFNKNYINLRIKYLGKIDKIIALLKNQNIFLKFENEEWNLKII